MALNSWTSSYRLGFLRPVLQYLFLPFFPSFFSFFDSEVQDSVHVIPLHPSWLYNIIILFLPILNVHWMFQLYVTWKKKNSIHLQSFLTYKHFHFLSSYLEQHFKGLLHLLPLQPHLAQLVSEGNLLPFRFSCLPSPFPFQGFHLLLSVWITLSPRQAQYHRAAASKRTAPAASLSPSPHCALLWPSVGFLHRGCVTVFVWLF